MNLPRCFLQTDKFTANLKPEVVEVNTAQRSLSPCSRAERNQTGTLIFPGDYKHAILDYGEQWKSFFLRCVHPPWSCLSQFSSILEIVYRPLPTHTAAWSCPFYRHPHAPAAGPRILRVQTDWSAALTRTSRRNGRAYETQPCPICSVTFSRSCCPEKNSVEDFGRVTFAPGHPVLMVHSGKSSKVLLQRVVAHSWHFEEKKM